GIPSQLPRPHLTSQTGDSVKKPNHERRGCFMKELGEFNFKATSITCQLNEQQLVQIQVNLEGRTTDGHVQATMSVSPGKAGQYSIVGVNYQDNGNIITARGQGQYESIGQGKQHRWKRRPRS